MKKIFRHFSERGFLLTSALLWREVALRLRSIIVGRQFTGAKNFRIGRFSRVFGASKIQIGDNFSAGDHFWLEAVENYRGIRYTPKISLGKNVSFSDFVRVSANHSIEIGDDLLTGGKIYICDHAHGIYQGQDQSIPSIPPLARPLSLGKPIKIGKNVWLGEMVTILGGVSIGDGAIIGANSVVTRDVPAQSIAVGSPARIVKRFDPQSKAWVATVIPS